jgi:hypothetical protein
MLRAESFLAESISSYLALGRISQEAKQNACAAERIAQSNHPGRGVIVKQFRKPVSDEALFPSIGLPASKVELEARQRADRSEPGLNHHRADCRRVNQTNRPGSDRKPARRPAESDTQLDEHHEAGEDNLGHQNGICGRPQGGRLGFIDRARRAPARSRPCSGFKVSCWLRSRPRSSRHSPRQRGTGERHG